MSMYLDLDSYADYIAAYKTYMVDTARVMVRELGTGVSDEQLALVGSFSVQRCLIVSTKRIFQAADKMFDFEREVAMRMTPSSDRRNSTAMYNPMLVSELKQTYTWFDWSLYFDTIFAHNGVTVGDDERIILVQPSYFEATGTLSADHKTIANYFWFQTWMSFAGELTQEMRDIAWKYQSATSGVDVQSPRWQTCLSKAVGAFGFAAAHEYVIANFEESAKAQADQMVENLRAAFKELVEETDWMDAETQVKAQEKADQMLQLIGYPDWLIDNAEVDKYYG